MRLISQDGKYDIPYDSFTIHIDDEMILITYIEAFTTSGSCIVLGEYSSKQKALAVMKEIRDLSADPDVVYYELPKDEDVDWLEEECDG